MIQNSYYNRNQMAGNADEQIPPHQNQQSF